MKIITKIISILLFLIVTASANPFGPGYVQDKSVFGFGN